MPSWSIHSKYAWELWRIDSSEVDEFIDRECHHDIGRFIAEQVWDLRELIPTTKLVYRRFGEDGVRAFLLHHILDYLDSLLRSLPVLSTGGFPKAFQMTEKTIENTINELQMKASSLDVDGSLLTLIIDAFKDISRLIRERRGELLMDIDPISIDALNYVRDRLIQNICKECGARFSFPSKELISFLSGLGISIPRRFSELCPRCREERLGVWLYREYLRIRDFYSSSPLGSPFHRTYYGGHDELWAETMRRFYAIIAILGEMEHEV